jgi:hypothetical protein
MDEVPLRRSPFSPDAPGAADAAARPGKRRSVVGKVFRGIGWLGSGPIHWMGVESIKRGGAFIGDLSDRLRARPRRDPRFWTEEAGKFDLRATAFSFGISVDELERRFVARRRQTAFLAYVLSVLASLFFGAWLVKVVHTPVTAGRLMLAFDFLPLCLLFVLLAFYQALVNYQIRVGRSVSWREYVTTDSGFWPRP